MADKVDKACTARFAQSFVKNKTKHGVGGEMEW